MSKIISYGHQSIDSKDIDAVEKVLRSDWITQGPAVEKFEKSLASFVNTKYCASVSSGTAALHLACLAAGIGPGDEVIVPTLSFVATANCVLYCGAKPVLVDVYENTLTINVEEAEKKINKKTKAIIAVDFAGHPADWNKLKKLAKIYNLILIDDASHALGSSYRSKPIGSIADLTTFSFHPVKTITTGEGGAITTNNKKLHERISRLRHHGIIKSEKSSQQYGEWYYQIDELGYNFRLTDIQAALGLSQLKKIGGFIKQRRALWQKYSSAFKNTTGLELPIEQKGYYCAWHIYPIRIEGNYKRSRKQVFDFLKKAGINVQVHYIPIHLFNLYKNKFGYKQSLRSSSFDELRTAGLKTGGFPVAETYYKNALTLPLFVGLKGKDQDYIIRKVKEALI
ncbi:UDP-4-amino-4,6-dideoxy-N-acetyl-beta-L-altrosamine transaminase [Candidatus Curtissbacteria bacterium RIFCSPLOWO2_01_FULL_39_62]|nr:MAG: UDP-4-amino-4,6-dideoxy-N-acetyl-beta-L-altrosamine transaminase [Candidatus Curtissbacteria bacterium RIFCSPHIGHO2_12_FULL_38_37]OGE02372.1 MAG: UDP-4-amino-4,6-dideoxy-N-acetyl-beta-L-altrosamine transaminase [Candidatus Curtissbacteria bacterium RIFCSPLOWO2_01_FULL_39_62]